VVEREEEKIAVIPLGYFDGIHRHYSGKGEVSICGKLAPMVGSICMDFMMCDITHIAEAKVGDVVTVFGGLLPSLSIEEFAFRGDSISHELIACLGPRIQRIFVYE
jgi:alanine racemase/UDP-N-acetylmuramoyl-tripeptide--D-alanyl-D-alanine ligase